MYDCTFPVSDGRRKALSPGAIAGIVTGSVILVLMLAALAVYAVRQKRRAEHAMTLTNPFGNLLPLVYIFYIQLRLILLIICMRTASWTTSGKESGGAPQLKGARWFSYDELKKCTNNFSESNQIGSGGYGKVRKL